MLEVSNLSCSRGDHRLFSGLNLALLPGQIMQVRGENGKGKTSLLRTLCGFLLPDEGQITWYGSDVRKLGEELFCQPALSRSPQRDQGRVKRLGESADLGGVGWHRSGREVRTCSIAAYGLEGPRTSADQGVVTGAAPSSGLGASVGG